MGFGPLWKGCWAAKREGLYGYPVNRWSIKRPPNGTKLDRRSTGAIPRPLGKTQPILRTFNTRSQQETKGGPPNPIYQEQTTNQLTTGTGGEAACQQVPQQWLNRASMPIRHCLNGCRKRCSLWHHNWDSDGISIPGYVDATPSWMSPSPGWPAPMEGGPHSP